MDAIVDSFWESRVKIYFHRPEDKLKWVIKQLGKFLPSLTPDQVFILNMVIQIIGEVRNAQAEYVQNISFEFDGLYRMVYDFMEVCVCNFLQSIRIDMYRDRQINQSMRAHYDKYGYKYLTGRG